ncbi:MAG: hypothetical protein ACRD82_10375, partial [Blastocatellia bacterium]
SDVKPTADLLFMLTRIRNLIFVIAAFAVVGQVAFGEFRIGSGVFHGKQRFSVSGWIENNGGKLRLVLTNDSSGEFRGSVRISLGSSEEQKEVGQVSVTLPPKEVSLMQINGVTPSGDHYTLAIYDQLGGRLFFRIAPLRQVSDPTPAVAVTINPVQQQRSKAGTSTSASGSSVSASPASSADQFAAIATQVQVKARLLASQDASDSFTLFFELSSQRPVNAATLEITASKLKDQKQVSINSQSNVEFRLPDSLETDKVKYTLTDKDGRILAKGELDLLKLMDDDFITVSDIRTDRHSYQSGETVRITIMMDGKSQSGYRLEVSARDGQSQTIFRDQKVVGRDENVTSLEFSFTLPSGVPTPVVFEFRIFDAETGLLFDSGEREVPMAPAKPPSQ